jgi:hypothetical protein
LVVHELFVFTPPQSLRTTGAAEASARSLAFSPEALRVEQTCELLICCWQLALLRLLIRKCTGWAHSMKDAHSCNASRGGLAVHHSQWTTTGMATGLKPGCLLAAATAGQLAGCCAPGGRYC